MREKVKLKADPTKTGSSKWVEVGMKRPVPMPGQEFQVRNVAVICTAHNNSDVIMDDTLTEKIPAEILNTTLEANTYGLVVQHCRQTVMIKKEKQERPDPSPVVSKMGGGKRGKGCGG